MRWRFWRCPECGSIWRRKWRPWDEGERVAVVECKPCGCNWILGKVKTFDQRPSRGLV